MTRDQAQLLERNGHVCLADNHTGFLAYVVNGGRSAIGRHDPNCDPDPDDRRTSAVESVQEREARFAEGRKVAAEIETKLADKNAKRVQMFDQMLPKLETPEARERLLYWRNHGMEFMQVWDDVARIEKRELAIIDHIRQCRAQSLGLTPETNAARAARYLDDDDKDVAMLARLIHNREKLPGEQLDEPEETEPSSTKKKKKLGSREGQEEEFEEAKKGNDKPSQTDGDDIDAEMDKFYKSRGWK